MSFLAYQQQATAIFYAILGRPAEATAINFFGNKLAKGDYKTTVELAKAFINGKEGQSYYGKLSNDAALIKIYTNVYGATPDAATLNQLKSTGTLEQVAANLVDNLFAYTGTAPNILAAQSQFNNKVNAALFPTTSPAVLSGAADIQAIFHLLGTLKTAEGINYWGGILTKKTHTATELVEKFIVNNKQSLLTDVDFINNIFKNGFERAATQTELTNYLDKLNSGQSRGDLVVDLIATLRGKLGTADQQAQQHFKNATYVFAQGELPPALYQEKAAIIYLTVLGRSIDASGLDTWSKYLYEGKSESSLINAILGSAEYKANNAPQNLNDYIQHIHTLLHNEKANQDYIKELLSISTDRGVITAKIINDFRSITTSGSETTPLLLQQHKFENAISNSLNHQKSAILTASNTNENPSSTVNSGKNHVLTNAEVSALKNITLNSANPDKNISGTYNLTFADNLVNLTINGDSHSKVYLSNTGLSTGATVTINNSQVEIWGKASNYNFIITDQTDITNHALKINFTGPGNNVFWAGNNGEEESNTVNPNLSIRGAEILSANFIVKTTTASLHGSGGYTEAVTDYNSDQFSFAGLDFGGYTGKARGVVIPGADAYLRSAENKNFDWGMLQGRASLDGIGGEILGSYWKSYALEKEPYLALSSRADNVKVREISGENSNYFKIVGDPTAASNIYLHYNEYSNFKDFVIQFMVESTTDVNAGTIEYGYTGWSNGIKMDTVRIESGGIGNFSNSLNLISNSTSIKYLNISGDHYLNLPLGKNFPNLRDIDASSNSAGINLEINHGGTGNGILLQLLNLLPLNPATQAVVTPLINKLGLNGYSLTVEGSKGNDTLNLAGNTIITGGIGNNSYYLDKSHANTGVTITDFNVTKDTIYAGDLKLDNSAGFSVADYGTRSQELVSAQLGGLAFNLVGGAVELLAGVLGLQNGGLTSKVGIAAVSFGFTTDSYLIIDNNNDHKLDSGDTVIHLKNLDPKVLLNQLHYNEITLNGVNNHQTHDAVAA